MAKHTRSHSCTEKSCSFRSFGIKADLLRHQREVHGQNPNGKAVQAYSCPELGCNRQRKGFSRYANMQEHCRRMHPESQLQLPNSQSELQESSWSLDTINSASDSPKNSDNSILPTPLPQPSPALPFDNVKAPQISLVEGLQAELRRLRQEKEAMNKRFEGKIEAILKVVGDLGSEL